MNRAFRHPVTSRLTGIAVDYPPSGRYLPLAKMGTFSEVMPFQMEPGQRFAGKYVVERVLGMGGMGVVIAALHEQLNQKVAIKLLSVPPGLQPEAVGRFINEARAAAALKSEHIARVVDVGIDELGRHYLVMEHLEGEDLGATLWRQGSFPISSSVGYVVQACEAIAEAHSLGIVHRDLKPENLFLTHRKDGTPLIKVLDFGISKMIGNGGNQPDAPTMTSSHTLLGTPVYMSPEQVRGPGLIDGRADVWALGVILYELLTSRRPFQGETVADVIAAILTVSPAAPASILPEIPSQLSEVVMACLEKEHAARMANVGLLAERLRPWAPRWARDAAARAARIAGASSPALDETGNFPVLAADPAPPAAAAAAILPRRTDAVPGPSARTRRWPALGLAVVLGAALAFGIVTVSLKREHQPPSPAPSATNPGVPPTAVATPPAKDPIQSTKPPELPAATASMPAAPEVPSSAGLEASRTMAQPPPPRRSSHRHTRSAATQKKGQRGGGSTQPARIAVDPLNGRR